MVLKIEDYENISRGLNCLEEVFRLLDSIRAGAEMISALKRSGVDCS